MNKLPPLPDSEVLERNSLKISLKEQEKARFIAENDLKTVSEKSAKYLADLELSRKNEAEAVGKLSVTQKQIDKILRDLEVSESKYKDLQEKYQVDCANKDEQLAAALKASEAISAELKTNLESQERAFAITLAQKEDEIKLLRQNNIGGYTAKELWSELFRKLTKRSTSG